MSYLERLRERRKTPVAAWHKLRTSISTGKFDYYAAFEGEEDEEFYSHFLSQRFPSSIFFPIICDGKGGVLALHDKVVATYGEPKNVFFFIDSDHDPFLGNDQYPDQIFSTCGYSVESYLYDEGVVVEGVKKCFRLNSADELCREIAEAYVVDSAVFEAHATKIMTYAIALRAQDQNPDVDAVGFNELFEIDGGYLRIKGRSCAELLNLASAEAPSGAALVAAKKKVSKKEVTACIRGKLVAQFVLSFCRSLPKRFEGRLKLNGKALKSRVELSKKNLVGLFVEYVDLPKPLSDFFAVMEQRLALG